jgi:CubicO group peptidase (beta-lactamase class C family)
MRIARHLLTHTSGISHPAWNSRLYEYLTSQCRSVALSCKGKIITTCLYPLVFEPGTSWEYGAGLEWAGKMVERLNGNISLQQYMETNIWTPLNMTTATFRLSERPDLKEKLPEMMFRQGLNHPIYGTTMSPGGRIVPGIDDEKEKAVAVEELLDDHIEDGNLNNQGDDDFGGGGAYCSAPDFAKILSSLCSNDGKLLRPYIVNEMFRPQLGPEARARVQNFFAIKQINDIFAGGLPQTNPPLPLDWGLGGMLVMEDVPSGLGHAGNRRGVRRSKGSMFWAGLPNLYWWMDRQTGVSGFYASQLLPQGDPRSTELFGEFEEWVYERAGFGVKGDGMGISASL